jgi:hypothetical protein
VLANIVRIGQCTAEVAGQIGTLLAAVRAVQLTGLTEILLARYR